MNRKIEKFRSLPDFSEETRFGPDCCQGHFGGYQAKTMERFDDKVNRLEPVAEWEHAS